NLDDKGRSSISNSRAGEKHDKYASLSRNSKAGDQDNCSSEYDPKSKIHGSLSYYDKKVRTESESPCHSDLKQKINHGKIYDGDDYSNDVRCSLVNGRDKYKEKARSESRDKHRDELHVKRGSKSRDLVRERSHSQSGLEDEDHWKRRRRNEYIDKDSDDERTSRGSRDVRSSRDYGRERDRESSVSYSRYPGRDDRHSHHDDYGKDRNREREMDRDRRREKGRERSRDIETYMDRNIEHEQRRDQEHSRSRDRELDPKKRREREQEKAKDGSKELDWRHKARDRDSYKYTERDRGSDKYMERDRGKDKEGDKYRERDREYDHGSERGLGWRNDRNSGKDRGGKSDSATFYGANSDSFENGREKVKRDEDEQEDFEERMTLILAEEEDDELDRIKEESRRLREAILEKYRKQQLQQASEPNMMDAKKGVEPAEHPGQSLPSSDNDIALQTVDGSSGGRDMNVAAPTVSLGKSPLQNVVHVSDDSVSPGGLGEGTPKSERSEERYCDDIFGETPTTIRKVSKVDGLPVVRSALHDNWDDAEGYYSYRFGEILDGRYEIIAAHGRGVFSTVVRAKDLKAGNDEPEEVAIKIIRNNETMNKISQVEVSILNKLAGADLENRRHCVRFLSHFKYRNHTCLVFESLHMNLREILKKFGRNIGLKLTAIRAYAKQLFIALKHLRNCGVLHCDIKPDNMLVNEAKNVLKLCDFGNAMFSGKNEITPYLVSRFYRAPEIILGLSYDHPMDIWSVGCCLYELYTGKVLFPGSTNNDMLRLHMELKGPFPKKMLKKGAFVDQHFDHDLNFYATEQDSVSDKIIKRMIVNVKPKDIGSIVKGSPGEDPKMLANFKDLLEKVFILDPEKRMTVSQALNHPFITGK
ncbi:Serine/threonine-protein kinase PRP4 homolog, partial [Linum perenne]